MKHLILTTALCLSLTACETVSNMSWPSLNPFGSDKEVKKVEIDTPEIPATPVEVINQSAIQTELDEMEKLTGTRMKAQDFIAQKSIDDAHQEQNSIPKESPQKVAETIDDIQNNIAPVLKEPIIESKIIENPDFNKEEKPIEVITENQNNVKTSKVITSMAMSGCPKIEIIPATKSITKFNPANPTQMTARASMADIKGGCEVVKGGMEIDLDILMRGTITNKGRFEGKMNEEAFVTFPYFVSIIKPNGMPIDKKIMATAMRFRPSVDYVDHAEKITQFVPMDDVKNSGNYTINVGFQLTRIQLGYNKMEINANRASPDTSKVKRRSYNPLAGE